MQCSEIMKRQLHTVLPELPVNEAARLMKTERIGFLPVCDAEGYAVGVLTDRDIALRLCAEDLRGSTKTVAQIMTPSPVECRSDDTVEHAEKLMIQRKTRRILIVDESGKLVGLIGMAEIAQHEAPYKAANWFRQLSARRFRVEH